VVLCVLFLCLDSTFTGVGAATAIPGRQNAAVNTPAVTTPAQPHAPVFDLHHEVLRTAFATPRPFTNQLKPATPAPLSEPPLEAEPENSSGLLAAVSAEDQASVVELVTPERPDPVPLSSMVFDDLRLRQKNFDGTLGALVTDMTNVVSQIQASQGPQDLVHLQVQLGDFMTTLTSAVTLDALGDKKQMVIDTAWYLICVVIMWMSLWEVSALLPKAQQQPLEMDKVFKFSLKLSISLTIFLVALCLMSVGHATVFGNDSAFGGVVQAGLTGMILFILGAVSGAVVSYLLRYLVKKPKAGKAQST